MSHRMLFICQTLPDVERSFIYWQIKPCDQLVLWPWPGRSKAAGGNILTHTHTHTDPLSSWPAEQQSQVKINIPEFSPLMIVVLATELVRNTHTHTVQPCKYKYIFYEHTQLFTRTYPTTYDLIIVLILKGKPNNKALLANLLHLNVLDVFFCYQ